MKNIFYWIKKLWTSCMYGKVQRPVAPMAFADPSQMVIRNMDRQRGLGPFGIRDCILLSDRFAAHRAAATLEAARINRGQWHRWHGGAL